MRLEEFMTNVPERYGEALNNDIIWTHEVAYLPGRRSEAIIFSAGNPSNTAFRTSVPTLADVQKL